MVYKVGVTHVSHFLKEVDIFKGLSEQHLDRIAGLCEEYSFKAGDYLGIQGTRGDKIYIIRRGEITVNTGAGQTQLVVRTVRERETFPVAVLFEPPLLVTTTRAATDGEAFALPRVRLMELCELEPKIGMHIFKAVCEILMSRYRYTLNRLAESADADVHIGALRDGSEV